jgi:hypothetical protein
MVRTMMAASRGVYEGPEGSADERETGKRILAKATARSPMVMLLTPSYAAVSRMSWKMCLAVIRFGRGSEKSALRIWRSTSTRLSCPGRVRMPPGEPVGDKERAGEDMPVRAREAEVAARDAVDVSEGDENGELPAVRLGPLLLPADRREEGGGVADSTAADLNAACELVVAALELIVSTRLAITGSVMTGEGSEVK